MIHRFSQDLGVYQQEKLLEQLNNGEIVDFDKVWRKENKDERVDKLDSDTLYHGGEDPDAFTIGLLVLAGVMSGGIWPVVDSIAFAIKRGKQKHFEKLDSQNDIIAVSVNDVFMFSDRIKAKVSELVKQGHKVNVVVDGCAQKQVLEKNQRIEYNFDTSKLIKLCDLEYDLKKLGMTEPLRFNEFFQTTKYSDLKTCWTLEQVIEANNEIDKVVSRIRDLKLSPYETMVYIHKYLTQNYGYGFNVSKKLDERNARESEKNRSIIAAIKKKKTICAGYASLTKAIIDRLNMPELKCEYQIATCWTPKDENTLGFNGGHALAHVTIEDPKYDIKGSYLNDATWDAKDKKHPYGRGYTYFMYPVMDAQKLRPMFISDSYGSRATIRTRDFPRKISPRSEDASVPIPYDTFENAVKQVYSLESDFCQGNEPYQAATQDIQLSLRRAWNSRIDDVNPLVKQVDVVYTVSPQYNRKHKIKNVKFELKNEVVNANRGMEQ